MQRLGQLLREAGLTRSFIRRMTERGDDLRSPLTPTREAIYTDDPAALLLRLFFCGHAIGRDELPEAFRGCEIFENLGDGRVRSPLHLRLVRDLYLFSDYLGDNPDAVMGAGETTAILYRAARPRSRVKRALDLGCGAGTLALLLADVADFVTGTDINPRAVWISRLNASVNGIDNAEFRTGDVFEPVAGEQFDWIVSQPPYYPDGVGGSGLTYLHGGSRGDELPARVMRGIPAHLSPSGSAFVFASWPEDRRAESLPEHDCLELLTNRRELHGTRQSLTIIRPGSGWSSQFVGPADCWDAVCPQRINDLFAGHGLLNCPDSILQEAALRLSDGVTVSTEGSQTLLWGEPESLIGCAPVDDSTVAVLQAIDRRGSARDLDVTQLSTLRRALRRGFLTLAKLERTTQSYL
jgi:SAM-dependent methyltransferase